MGKLPNSSVPCSVGLVFERVYKLLLAIASLALDEVSHKVPDCKSHLIANGVTAILPTNSTLLQAAAKRYR